MLRPLRPAFLLCSATVLALLTAAAPAAAHPFGPPLRAQLVAEGATVTVRWSAAEDDWVSLARHVGAFEETPAETGPGQVSGLERLQRSELLRRYLLENVAVAQEGTNCPGEVTDVASLHIDGVVLSFTCRQPVKIVDVRLTVLSDVHEAYRTSASTQPQRVGQRALYTRTDPLHTWDFSAEPVPAAAGGGPPLTFGLSAVLVVVAAALAVIGLWQRPPQGAGVSPGGRR